MIFIGIFLRLVIGTRKIKFNKRCLKILGKGQTLELSNKSIKIYITVFNLTTRLILAMVDVILNQVRNSTMEITYTSLEVYH